jgi:prepilin-type processing-associated H-X9-DG protein
MTNVLYADGHVEMQPIQFVKQRVEQQKKPGGAGQ